ncbi:GNAT family N-acetyltransferase [Thalassospira sp.]|uniref:GNAT family N-acetyltransferase n=1 Tax=Thalassospira sp. TaxID=1912094 RepID=UPI003AA831B7
MSTNLEIAPLLNPDIAVFNRLTGILKAAFAFQDGIVNPPSSVTRVDEAELQWRFERDMVLVARDIENDHVIVGQVWIEETPDDAYIYKMSVDPAYHGKGIGRALIDAAVNHVLQKGRNARMRLHVRKELAGNISFFTRCGFAITGDGTHPGFSQPTFFVMTRDVAVHKTPSPAL